MSRKMRVDEMGHELRSHNLLTQATTEDKDRWRGFCEIESEPALFNALVKDFGVLDIQFREIFTLDRDSLTSLPTDLASRLPVHGLVLLFKWYDEDSSQQQQSCPSGIWFANQTVNGACASVALLNLINNVSGIDMGQPLRAFRDFTHDLSPADRGDAIANFDFIRRIHNSFAKKLDIQNADLYLSNEACKGRKVTPQTSSTSIHDAAFHFVAFMPIDSQLWKLDGLERQPVCLGEFKDGDWLQKARPDLENRMIQCQEGNLGFALLSLLRDPLVTVIENLVRNILNLRMVDSMLDRSGNDWRHSNGGETLQNLITLDDIESEAGYRIVNQACQNYVEPQYSHLNDFQALMAERRELLLVQASLNVDLRECRQKADEESLRAEARRHDFGTRMQGFARFVRERTR